MYLPDKTIPHTFVLETTRVQGLGVPNRWLWEPILPEEIHNLQVLAPLDRYSDESIGSLFFTRKHQQIKNKTTMRHSDCYSCGYFREETRPDGSTRNYCNDRDCTVDPFEPDCNYD